MEYFHHGIYSSEDERPVRGINTDEFHTYNVRGKKAIYKRLSLFIWSSKYMQLLPRVLEVKVGVTSEEALWLARSWGGFEDVGPIPFFDVGLGYLMQSHKNSLSCTNMICAHFCICVILQSKVKEEDQGSIPKSATHSVTSRIHFMP